MAQSFSEELRFVQQSRALADSLARAAGYASAQVHRFVTPEHVLLSLTEDEDALVVLAASKIDVGSVRDDVSAYLGRLNERLRPGDPPGPGLHPDLRRILEYASTAAERSRRPNINGAVVLATIVGEGRSVAANVLKAHGLTFADAIRTLQRQPPAQPQPPAPVAREEGLREGDTRRPVQPPPLMPGGPAPLARSPFPVPQLGPAPPRSSPPMAPPIAQGALGPAGNGLEAAPGEAALLPPWPAAAGDGASEPAPGRPAAPELPALADPATEMLLAQARQRVQAQAARAASGANTGDPATAPRRPRPPEGSTDHPPPAAASAPVMPPPVPVPAAAGAPLIAPQSNGAPIEMPAGQAPAGPHAASADLALEAVRQSLEDPSLSGQAVEGSAGAGDGASNGASNSAAELTLDGGVPLVPEDLTAPAPAAHRSGHVPPVHPHRPVPPRVRPRARAMQAGAPLAPAPVAASAGPASPAELIPIQNATQSMAAPWPEMTAAPAPPPHPQPMVADGNFAGAPYPAAEEVLVGLRGAPGSQTRHDDGARPHNLERGARPGEIIESIPRRMEIGRAHTIEIRIERELGTTGPGGPLISRAMSVRLRAPDGMFAVEPLSPETQWNEGTSTLMHDEWATWRFAVTPRRRGMGELQLMVGERTIGWDGAVADIALPLQSVVVRARSPVAATARRIGLVLAAMVAGGLIARLGDGVIMCGWQAVRQLAGL